MRGIHPLVDLCNAISRIRGETTTALIVAEALHATARADVERLIDTVAAELAEIPEIQILQRRSVPD